ncbi:RRNA biogenesis protein RRP36 [Aphelenchoides besseyi]|nr:RRNA biogenesis protein RRP36 [Aphelenchoides besseyi]
MSSSESESGPEEEQMTEVTGEHKVRALKAKLGVKLFDKAYFPEATSSTDKKAENSEEESDDEKPTESGFVRDNRKRPREISSKRPIKHNSLVVVKKKVRYDPRFECGEFDRVQYNRDYAFIDDMRRQELRQLKKAYRKELKEDAERAEQIRESARKLENQLRTADEINAELEAKSEIRQENIKRMNEGKRPIYLNAKQMKTKIMEKRFDKVKAKGNVKGYLKKRKEKALKKGVNVDE